MKSTTHNRFGAVAVKSRSTRSGGRVAAGSGLVMTNLLPRLTPRRPTVRISRSTVHRATGWPSRRSWCHTLRHPYRPRPIVGSLCTRTISISNASSLTDLAETGLVLAA